MNSKGDVINVAVASGLDVVTETQTQGRLRQPLLVAFVSERPRLCLLFVHSLRLSACESFAAA